MGRVRFITHRGARILLVDQSYCTPEQMLDNLDAVEQIVTAQPPDSVLSLSDFTGARFSKEAADRMKVVAAKDRPHVRRAALIGSESIPEVYFNALLSFSARSFARFATREEALEWLIAGEGEAAAS